MTPKLNPAVPDLETYISGHAGMVAITPDVTYRELQGGSFSAELTAKA